MAKTEKDHGNGVYDFFQLIKHNSVFYCSQGRRQKNSSTGGRQPKKQDRKIAPLNPPSTLSVSCMKIQGGQPSCPLPPPATKAHDCSRNLGFVGFSLAKNLRLVLFCG